MKELLELRNFAVELGMLVKQVTPLCLYSICMFTRIWEKYDMMCFVKHWMPEEELRALYIEECKLVLCFCRKSGRNGGVAIFARRGLDCVGLDIRTECRTEHDCEVSGALLCGSVVLIALYRSPVGNVDNMLHLLNILFTSNSIRTLCTELSSWNLFYRSVLRLWYPKARVFKTAQLMS